MNVGLREAKQLADTIADIVQDGAPMDRLETYATERREEWRGLLGLEGGLEPGATTDPWIRDYVDRLLPCIPASGEVLSDLVAQLGIERDAVVTH